MKNRIKVIFNPNAGRKKHITPLASTVSLNQIKLLFSQYQIEADFFVTRYPGHATQLAKDAVRHKYQTVVAAGGDGTVSEVADGLINTRLCLGILPLGTFMNTARMLDIPDDLEKAVMLLKIGRSRLLDIGEIISLEGKKLAKPTYFLENAGIGMEAELQEEILSWERGNILSLGKIFKTFLAYYRYRLKIVLDEGKTLEVRAPLVEVSNGPLTGAALQFAPKAKLNDHRFTVSVFEMTKPELFFYFLRMKNSGQTSSRHLRRYQSKTVSIITHRPRPVHADARIFGVTPVEFKIRPGKLLAITGFPQPGKSALRKRAELDP